MACWHSNGKLDQQMCSSQLLLVGQIINNYPAKSRGISSDT